MPAREPLVGIGEAERSRQALAEDLLQVHGEKLRLLLFTVAQGVDPVFAQHQRPLVGEILEPLQAKDVHLVLNACTREKDLVHVIESWKGFPFNRLAFTRLDEAGACGHLLNLLLRTRLPLSYLGTGPKIPEDLAQRPLELLLNLAAQMLEFAGGSSFGLFRGPRGAIS